MHSIVYIVCSDKGQLSQTFHQYHDQDSQDHHHRWYQHSTYPHLNQGRLDTLCLGMVRGLNYAGNPPISIPPQYHTTHTYYSVHVPHCTRTTPPLPPYHTTQVKHYLRTTLNTYHTTSLPIHTTLCPMPHFCPLPHQSPSTHHQTWGWNQTHRLSLPDKRLIIWIFQFVRKHLDFW